MNNDEFILLVNSLQPILGMLELLLSQASLSFSQFPVFSSYPSRQFGIPSQTLSREMQSPNGQRKPSQGGGVVDKTTGFSNSIEKNALRNKITFRNKKTSGPK